jgi:hypothetical protein
VFTARDGLAFKSDEYNFVLKGLNTRHCVHIVFISYNCLVLDSLDPGRASSTCVQNIAKYLSNYMALYPRKLERSLHGSGSRASGYSQLTVLFYYSQHTNNA